MSIASMTFVLDQAWIQSVDTWEITYLNAKLLVSISPQMPGVIKYQHVVSIDNPYKRGILVFEVRSNFWNHQDLITIFECIS